MVLPISAYMATKKKVDEEEVFKEILAKDASKTEYVPCGWVGSFSDLTDAQKRYYAYFRTILGIGSKNIRGDDGYYYLLVKECSRSEEDHRRLLDYLEMPKSSKFYNYASDLLPDLQMLYGRPPRSGIGQSGKKYDGCRAHADFSPKIRGRHRISTGLSDRGTQRRIPHIPHDVRKHTGAGPVDTR